MAGCGGEAGSGGTATPAPDQGAPGVIDARAPEGTERGRRVASDAGCLACHQLHGEGNDGPGPDLTQVGRRLDRAAIAGVLRSPPAPMPSYRRLPDDDFAALVEYLAVLR